MKPKNDAFDIEKEISDLSEPPSLFSKKEWQTLGNNCVLFFKFIGEVLAEKPEAESYPIYFLPSLVMIVLFSLILGGCIFQSTLATNVNWGIQLLLSITFAPAFLVGLIGGLKISTLFFKGTDNYKDLLIASAIFCTPLSAGFFLYWLLSYATILFALPILFFAHSTSIISLYIALPKILLLKGFSRFATILIAIGFGVFSTLILLRIILPIAS